MNVAFFNPNSSSAALKLTLSVPNGESLGGTSVLIPTFGYLQRSLTQLFGLQAVLARFWTAGRGDGAECSTQRETRSTAS